jgi:hypothetical protein
VTSRSSVVYTAADSPLPKNLAAASNVLSEADVKVDPKEYPNGRFARLHDREGNPIELWEPAADG